MDAAAATVVAAVERLCATTRGSDNRNNEAACVCMISVPAEWGWLRQFPVLKRSVLTQWQRSMQTRSATPPPALIQRFCSYLRACNVLHAFDQDTLVRLAGSLSLDSWRHVLTRPSGSADVAKDVALRLVLLMAVLSSWTRGCRNQRDVSASIQRTGRLVRHVCVNVREQVMAVALVPRTQDGDDGSKATRCCRGDCMRLSERERLCVVDTLAQTCRWVEPHEEGEGDGVHEAIRELLHALEHDGDRTRPSNASQAKPSRKRRRSATKMGAEALVRAPMPLTASLATLSREQYEVIIDSTLARLTAVTSSVERQRLLVLWQQAWRKRLATVATDPAAHQVVMACAQTDSWSRPLVGQTVNDHLPGVYASQAIIKALQLDLWAALALLERVAAVIIALEDRPHQSSLQHVLGLYLMHVLRSSKEPEGNGCVKSTSRPSNATVGHGLEVVYRLLVTESVEEVTVGWTALVHSLGDDGNGLKWLQGLAHACNAMFHIDRQASSVRDAFAAFVRRALLSVFRSNAVHVYCPGWTCRPLATDSTSIDAVRMAVTDVVNALPGDQLPALLFDVLRWYDQATSKPDCHAMALHALETLFFPALLGHFEHQPNGITACQQIWRLVCDRVASHHHRQALGVSVMRLSFSFTHVVELTLDRQSVVAWQSAVRTALLRGQILPFVLAFYSDALHVLAVSRCHLEPLRQFLQSSGSKCPPELEGQLFDVLSAVQARCVEDSEQLPPLRPEPKALLSHSDPALARFLAVFSHRQDRQAYELLRTLRTTPGKIEILSMCVLRWLRVVAEDLVLQSSDGRSLGAETHIELAQLCNRLLHWLPEEMRDVQALQTPLPAQLREALVAFGDQREVKKEEQPRRYDASNTRPLQLLMTTSSVGDASTASIVRLELTARAYLNGSVLPDLVAFTDVLMDALLSCPATSQRKALIRFTQRVHRSLVVDVVVNKLADALERPTGRKRRSKKTKTKPNNGDDAPQRMYNAVAILVLSPPVFGPDPVALSNAVFRADAIAPWLGCFYDILLFEIDSAPARLASEAWDQWLSCLETLLDAPTAPAVFRRSLAVYALLCMASWYLERDEAAVPAPLFLRLEVLITRLHALLGVNTDSVSQGKPSLLLVQRQDPDKLLHCSGVYFVADSVHTAERYEPFNGQSHALAQLMDQAEPESEPPAINAPCLIRHMRLPPTALFLPFRDWVRVAIRKTNSASLNRDAHSDRVAQWSLCIEKHIARLYLPVQFRGDVNAMMAEWMGVAIDILARHWKKRNELPQLVPPSIAAFVRRMYKHNSATPPVAWKLQFAAITQLLQHDIPIQDGPILLSHCSRSFGVMEVAVSQLDRLNSSQIHETKVAFIEAFEQALQTAGWRRLSASALLMWCEAALEISLALLVSEDTTSNVNSSFDAWFLDSVRTLLEEKCEELQTLEKTSQIFAKCENSRSPRHGWSSISLALQRLCLSYEAQNIAACQAFHRAIASLMSKQMQISQNSGINI